MGECFDRTISKHMHVHTHENIHTVINTVSCLKATSSNSKQIAREGPVDLHEYTADCIDTMDDHLSNFDPPGLLSLNVSASNSPCLHSVSPPPPQQIITDIIIKTLNKITGCSRGSLFGHVVSVKPCVCLCECVSTDVNNSSPKVCYLGPPACWEVLMVSRCVCICVCA